MKLNLDCIRDTMLAVEKLHQVFINDENEIEKGTLILAELCEALPQHRMEDVFYSVYNLDQAGYLSVSIQWIGGCVYNCVINHMTYEGNEFLEKIRPETIWGKTTSILGKLGNFGLQTVSKIAEGIAAAYLNRLLGD